jgi:hypothetical protein|tara:strand:+ start:406 stop:567 length:162 start_codon:yes stop_codon:yes gene_type:complete
MTKGKEVIKKNKEKWKEHKWIFEGYHYTMIYNKDSFHIIHESSGRVITKGDFK